jgi:hypothetical protein
VEDIENLAPAESTISTLGAPPPDRLAIHPSNVISADVLSQIATMGCGGPDQTFEPAEIRYIKLGENGKWATDALEQGTIPFGYRSVDHRACLAGNWDEVRRQLLGMGRTAGGVSQGLRELKDFYGLPESTLWVTMADGHFWWAFAEGPVVGIEPGNSDEPARYRRTRAGWSKTSLTGEPLTVRSLSSALTRTASYQMTICAIKHADYLLRRIRDEPAPVHAQATALGPRPRNDGQSARIRPAIFELVLRFGCHFTVNGAFQRYGSQEETRREIILQFSAFSRVVAGGRHLLNATFDIEAAELGDARIAPGGIDQSIRVDSQMLSVLDDI